MAHRIAELMTLAENTSDETTREDARQKCAETIIKLWEARRGWLRGNPLANIAEYLQAFKEFNNEYALGEMTFSDPEGDFEEQPYQEDEIEKGAIAEEEQIDTEINPLIKLLLPRKLGLSGFGKQPPANWLEVFLRVVQLNLREERVLRDLALAELPLENVQDWLENLAEFLSKEEREILEIFQEQKAELNSPDFKLDNTAAPNFATMSIEERSNTVRNVLQKISKEREQIITDYSKKR